MCTSCASSFASGLYKHSEQLRSRKTIASSLANSVAQVPEVLNFKSLSWLFPGQPAPKKSTRSNPWSQTRSSVDNYSPIQTSMWRENMRAWPSLLPSLLMSNTPGITSAEGMILLTMSASHHFLLGGCHVHLSWA